MPNKIIANRYEVGALIGSGGLGQVYRGHDALTGRDVAIKVIVTTDDRTAALILREARLLMHVRSPAVAVYIDFVVDGSALIVILELLDGTPLDVWTRGRSLAQVVDVFADIARGLMDIHGASIVHRDLKPSNVIVLNDDTRGSLAVITDFGLAVSRREPDLLTRSADTIVGTPLYMAPETYRGGDVSPAVDVFALGVMLFETLVGHSPWSVDGSFEQTARSVLAGLSANATKELQAHGSAKLVDLVTRMLAPSPTDRPSAALVFKDLRTIAAEITLSVPRRKRSWTEGSPKDNVVSPATAPPDEWAASSPPPTLRQAPAGRSLLGPLSSRWTLLVFLVLGLLVPLLWNSWRSFGAKGLLEISAAAVLAVSGVLTLVVSRRVRRREIARPATDEGYGLETRIKAIERRLEEVGSVSASMAVQVGSIREHVDGGELKDALRATLVAALRETGIGTPRNDLEQVFSGLRDIVSKRDDPPWYKRASTWLTLVGTLVTTLGGAIGLAGATGIWKPNTRPVIRSFGVQTSRALRTKPLELPIDAEDADGDPLNFRYEASSGRIEGEGPLALWHADAATGDVVVVRAFVSDGRATVSTERSVRVNRAPLVELRLPAAVPPGGSVRIEALGVDEDGDAITFQWEGLPARILPESGPSVTLFAPARPGELVIRCVASDGFESVEKRGLLRVARAH